MPPKGFTNKSRRLGRKWKPGEMEKKRVEKRTRESTSMSGPLNGRQTKTTYVAGGFATLLPMLRFAGDRRASRPDFYVTISRPLPFLRNVS